MPPQTADVGGRYSLPLALGRGSQLPVRLVEDADGAAPAPASASHAHISSAAAREASIRAVAALAAEQGFDASNASALHVLVDAMGAFVRQVAGMAQASYAEASHRPLPVLHDGVAALWDVGGPLAPPQLKLFAQKRGASLSRSIRSRRGRSASVSAPPRHPAPVPLQCPDPPQPTWADPGQGFLAAEGDLEPEPPVLPHREDVPIPGRVGAFKSAVLPYPPLPAGYTYRSPENDGQATSFTGEGPSSALVAVEKAWTKSQLTQASLKSLIRRIDAATQGVPFEEDEAAAPAPTLPPATPGSGIAPPPAHAPTSATAPGPAPATATAPAPAAPPLKSESDAGTYMDLDSSSPPPPPPQAEEDSRRKRMKLSLSTSGLGGVDGSRPDLSAAARTAPVRSVMPISGPEAPLPLSATIPSHVQALMKSPFAFPPPSPVSRTFIRAWQEAHPSTPTTPAAPVATPAPELDAFTPSSLPGVVNFKSTWFAPRVRPRSQAG